MMIMSSLFFLAGLAVAEERPDPKAGLFGKRDLRPPPGPRWADTVYIDWTLATEVGTPPRLVYPANTALQICVKHPEKTLMNASTTASIGLDSPIVLTVLGNAGPERATALVHCTPYASFTPGVVPIELTLTQPSTTERSPTLWLAAQDETAAIADETLATFTVKAKEDALALAEGTATTAATEFTNAKAAEAAAKASGTAADVKAAAGKVAAAKVRHDDAQTAKGKAEEELNTARKVAEEAVTARNTATTKRMETALEPQVLRQETLSLIIEPYNVGAVRVGVAAGWSRTADGQYEARVKPSSAEENADEAAADGEDATAASPEAVITQTGGGKESVEFVVSYTHFFTPVTDSYTGCHKGVMLGLGIADLQTAELGLSSVYLGFDLGWRLLSVSPSVTMRRVTMLAEGVELDSPVKSTQEIPLKEVWTPGFALVVHAPLDLMGAARSKGE